MCLHSWLSKSPIYPFSDCVNQIWTGLDLISEWMSDNGTVLVFLSFLLERGGFEFKLDTFVSRGFSVVFASGGISIGFVREVFCFFEKSLAKS